MGNLDQQKVPSEFVEKAGGIQRMIWKQKKKRNEEGKAIEKMEKEWKFQAREESTCSSGRTNRGVI